VNTDSEPHIKAAPIHVSGHGSRHCLIVMLTLVGLSAIMDRAHAEPWLAVRSGLQCANCHVNPSGGGQRTAFGNAWAGTALARDRMSGDDTSEPWTGAINRWLSVGGDFRARVAGMDIIDGDDPPTEFEVQDMFAYLTVQIVPNRLMVHIDQRVGPRGSSNRQSYALLRPRRGSLYMRAGRFFLPHGLRLADDSAFVRQATGINFTTPDTGVEFGLDGRRWSAQVAITNGTAGAPEIDDGKQLSASATYIRSGWRVGASVNHNDTDLGDRRMAGVHAGVRTGPVAWLAAIDYIRDDSHPGDRQDSRAALVEANWMPTRGHNLKLTGERLYPAVPGQRQRTRTSAVWEYFPVPFVQGRVGLRRLRGTADTAPQNRDEWFAQLHVYF
jgi:hypothetical protein